MVALGGGCGAAAHVGGAAQPRARTLATGRADRWACRHRQPAHTECARTQQLQTPHALRTPRTARRAGGWRQTGAACCEQFRRTPLQGGRVACVDSKPRRAQLSDEPTLLLCSSKQHPAAAARCCGTSSPRETGAERPAGLLAWVQQRQQQRVLDLPLLVLVPSQDAPIHRVALVVHKHLSRGSQGRVWKCMRGISVSL